jgi:hypothetical protein
MGGVIDNPLSRACVAAPSRASPHSNNVALILVPVKYKIIII